MCYDARMARESKPQISIRLSPKILDRIRQKAEREDSDRTKVIADAIEAYMLPAESEVVLCVQSHQPIAPGDPSDLPHCLGRHTHGGNCIFAHFARVPNTVCMAEEWNAPEGMRNG